MRRQVSNTAASAKESSFLLIARALSLMVLLGLSFPTQGQEGNLLLLTRRIALPAVQGGFNHMAVDTTDQRLFAPAPSNGTLEIVDLRSGKSWRSLTGERPTAAVYAPEFNQFYVTSGQTVDIYNARTLQAFAHLDLHTRLDQLRYDPQAKQLYVGCMGQDRTGIAMIAIPEGRLAWKVALADSPQGIAVEKNGEHIFANLPALNSIAVLNRRERKVIATWPLGGAQDNFPMALDARDHRLFIACRRPAEMLALDTQSGTILTRVHCVGDADDLWYDEAHKRIYITGGEGFVSVIEQESADRYRLLDQVATAPGAATSVFSRDLNSLFAGVPRRGTEPAEIRVYQYSRHIRR